MFKLKNKWDDRFVHNWVYLKLASVKQQSTFTQITRYIIQQSDTSTFCKF